MRRSAAPSQIRPSLFRPPTSSTPAAPQMIPAKNFAPASVTQPLAEASPNCHGDSRYFSVVWCKASGRKHKKWEDDALLLVRPQSRLAILRSVDGKELGRGSGIALAQLTELQSGASVSFGGKEVEVVEEITEEEFKRRQTGKTARDETAEQEQEKVAFFRPKVIDSAVFKPFSFPGKFGVAFSSPDKGQGLEKRPEVLGNPNAFILPRPPFDACAEMKENEVITDVVVDNYLSKQLRPHQKEGVIFLYRCVMGFNDKGCNGAILADEMGLGKTLQTITLIWTLMRQGPFSGRPVIKRTLILAPSSLVANWRAEFTKWLGTERIRVFAVDASNRVTEYIKSPNLPVLIMSYEMFVRSFEDLQRLSFDLIVCDEGHRLKNEKVKASTLLGQMETERRVVLTGTPLQNDLKEFYAIVCAVNPNVFGSTSSFSREFEDVIVRSKQPNASVDEIESGEIKMEGLNQLSSTFILRRTQDIISKYLPPKTEYVLFCRPTPLQAYLYKNLLGGLGDCMALEASCVLSSILQLRKVCNHPALTEFDQESISPELLEASLEEQGSKLAVVSLLLYSLRQKGSEKIVLVSISTQVLDLLQELCTHYSYPYLRLDGSTTTTQRQSVVNRFNSTHGDDFVLLLSSKAGGTGLNLIGASRILLYDMDWNPAHDIQAMARVWRDGQTKPVIIYRLATTGTIEEKIFQRQITKQGLGGGLVEEGHKPTQFHFTKDELRDLFSFDENSNCSTHDLLECDCDGTGVNIQEKAESRLCQLGGSEKENVSNIRDLLQWRHLLPPVGIIDDSCLEEAGSFITYALQNVHV